MLQRGIIKHIQAYDRSYHPEDNVLLMSVEFGMANQFILDLSKNVKRGLRTKAEKGWLPTTAPLGYLNDKSKERGKSASISISSPVMNTGTGLLHRPRLTKTTTMDIPSPGMVKVILDYMPQIVTLSIRSLNIFFSHGTSSRRSKMSR